MVLVLVVLFMLVIKCVVGLVTVFVMCFSLLLEWVLLMAVLGVFSRWLDWCFC